MMMRKKTLNLLVVAVWCKGAVQTCAHRAAQPRTQLGGICMYLVTTVLKLDSTDNKTAAVGVHPVHLGSPCSSDTRDGQDAHLEEWAEKYKALEGAEVTKMVSHSCVGGVGGNTSTCAHNPCVERLQLTPPHRGDEDKSIATTAVMQR